MGRFDDFFGANHPAVLTPGWASFLTAEQRQHFVALASEELQRRGASFTLDDQRGVIDLPEAAGDLPAGAYGLVPLAQRCRPAAPEEWPRLISDHFGQAAKVETDRRKLLSSVDDFTKVESHLCVRLWEPELATSALVAREDLPGLSSVLCFDLPANLSPVTKPQAERWNRPLDALFRTAVANSTRMDALRQGRVEIVKGMFVTALDGGSCTSAHALKLRDVLGPQSPLGLLVAVPHQALVLFHKIDTRDITAFVGAMGKMAYGIHQDGPASISPDLFWLNGGTYERIPVTKSEAGLAVDLPPTFHDRVLREHRH